MSEMIDINVDDAMDLVAVKEDEYTLRITGGTMTKVNEKGNQGLMVFWEIVGEENAEQVTKYFMFPNPDTQDKAKVNRCKLDLRDFYDAHGLTPPFEIEEMKDLECAAYLLYKAEVDPKYADKNGFRNEISRFIAAK